jgi:hypothetical protein
MQCRQCYVVAFHLSVNDVELKAVGAKPNPMSPSFFAHDTLLQLSCQQQQEQDHGVFITPVGYILHDRFNALLHWFKQQGLLVALCKNLSLIVYWHPESGNADTSNDLYKIALGMWIAVPETDILQKHRNGIIRCMKAGQLSAVICYLYKDHGYHKCQRTEPITPYVCTETRDFMTQQVIGMDKWRLDSKHHPLVDWLTKVENLQWSLRFTFKDNTTSQLHDWCLLIAFWY